MKRFLFTMFTSITLFLTHAELAFNPVSINKDNQFLFYSKESFGRENPIQTLFYGTFSGNKSIYQPVSFFPEKLLSNQEYDKFYIHNRFGLYYYDLINDKVNPVDIYPSYINKEEYSVQRLQIVSISPNGRYLIGKIPVSPTRSDLYLFDPKEKTSEVIIKNLETTPGSPSALWAYDSNYFVYQKNNRIYYFSITEYKKKKLLTEEWRWIGNADLDSVYWSNENYLIWIEDNLIYQADPNQFFYRSIYKSYLRQGEIIGKIPFPFDPAFDSFIYNPENKTFLIVRNGNSIYYFSITEELKQNPYLQLNDTYQFDQCDLFPAGDGILSVVFLENGKLNRKLILLKKKEQEYQFQIFNSSEIEPFQINSYSVSTNKDQFCVNTSGGVFCYDYQTLKALWKYDEEPVLSSMQLANTQWIIGGYYTTLKYDQTAKLIRPLFASSVQETGFVDNKVNIGIITGSKQYILNKNSMTLSRAFFNPKELFREEKNDKYRIMNKEIRKGFYKDAVYIKDLYSGIMTEITQTPRLRYRLYQPELIKKADYYETPNPEKYEVALVFNCIRSSEGMFPIMTTLDRFKIPSTFFINGLFMSINQRLTRELAYFDFEIGNLFHYYINLTDNQFLIDKNFIRQGLSINEEKFFNLTGKNFAPLWHSPFYAVNDTIISYGLDSGYRYVTYQLDSYDWVGENTANLDQSFYKSSAEIIDRILSNLKPGQIIIFNTGKNNTLRSDYLFNNLDLLISELVRSGYQFTTAGDLSLKYR